MAAQKDIIEILLIEDDEDHAELTIAVLAKHNENYKVDWVKNRLTGLDKLKQKSYNLILLDFILPGVDGLTFLDAFASRNISTPVIMVTGVGSEHIAVEAFRKGVTDYIIKSVNYLDSLPILVDGALKRAEHKVKVKTTVVKSIESTTNLVKSLQDEYKVGADPFPEQTIVLQYDTSTIKNSCYLIKDATRVNTFLAFKALINRGHQGLCITRITPNKITESYGINNVEFKWLSTHCNEDWCISPTNLFKISNIIRKFMNRNKSAVVLLEGLEYLVTQNNFIKILRLTQTFSEYAYLFNGTILIPIDLLSLEEKEIRLLARETTELKLD
jgi:DNA-binding response OmpR family regulator